MNKLAFRLSVAALLLAVTVVVLGAFTRLADAGLGCPDWPTCYGHLWVPISEAHVEAANEKFATTPVEHDKTWPEQTHRIAASTLGLFILAIFFVCYRQREPSQAWGSVITLLAFLVFGTAARIFVGDGLDLYLWLLVAAYFINLSRIATRSIGSRMPFKLPSLIAGLVVLQGLFGMWTVTLNLWPQVVTLHLMGGFGTLGLLWLLLQRLGQWHWQANAPVAFSLMSLRNPALIVLAVITLQIVLGGWLSSNYAALACPDFPLCQNRVWPVSDFGQGFNLLQDIGPNYLGGLLESEARVAIHLSHRLGAIIVLLVTSVFAFRLWQTGLQQAKNFSIVLITILGVQLALGIMNVVLGLPLWVAVAHNAIGALLLLTIITINHRLRTVVTL